MGRPLGSALALLIAVSCDITAALNISDAGSYTGGTVQPASTGSDGTLLQPFATDEPSTTLFTRYSTLSTLAPVINVADDMLKTPIPTNKWWANLISATVGDDTVAVPAFANPYTVELPRAEAPYGLQMCYSYTYRQTSEVDADGAIEFYLHEFHNDMTLSATEFTARPDYEIYSWTDVGATLRTCVSGSTNCMDSALINGMAFVSATYTGLTPSIQSEYTMTLASSDPSTGKYVLQLSNAQTWVLYASDTSATFTVDSTGTALVASGVYSGTLRLAILPAGSDNTLYDDYSGCIVRGGNVEVASRTAYSINWQTNGTSCESSGLFHFALQHQLDSFASEADVTTTTISLNSTTRGAMTGVVTTAAEWAFTEPEDDAEVDFFPPTDITADLVTQTNLLSTLQADIAATWAMDAESWYYNGKYYQKYATLCLMASNTNIVGSDTTLLATCLEKLETLITPFLTNTLEPPLAYETVYSGIVSSMTFTSNDVNVDFGNAVYNDHHYHYGYWVTASAILLKLDPDWTGAAQLETMIWTMLRDVANPSTDDPYFPKFRHFSWFLGHSVSHGVTPMADGKDEESTSEDINLYYGMKLWGQVMGNQAVEDLGSLMMRVDARAVRTYFLMTSDNTLHPAGFVKNHVTGIFFDNKSHYTTWFSAEKYCIHGIQMIPVSPINALARTSTFVQQEWDDILSKEPIVTSADTTNAWLSLLLVNQAFIDQADALAKLPTVTLDDGLTRSWALYNAATRGLAASGSSAAAPAATTATPVAA